MMSLTDLSKAIKKKRKKKNKKYRAKNGPGWVFLVLNSAVPRTSHCIEVLVMTILNCLMTPWVSMAFKNLLLFVLFMAQTLVQDSYLSSTIAIIV